MDGGFGRCDTRGREGEGVTLENPSSMNMPGNLHWASWFERQGSIGVSPPT